MRGTKLLGKIYARWPQFTHLHLDVVVERPARDLVMRGEPDVGKLRKVFQEFVEYRADERPATEMAMQREAEVGRRLAQIEVVERFLVNVPQRHWAGTRDAAVAEIARDIEPVAMRSQTFLYQEVAGVVGPR